MSEKTLVRGANQLVKYSRLKTHRVGFVHAKVKLEIWDEVNGDLQ
jgi:hypothetical protein